MRISVVRFSLVRIFKKMPKYLAYAIFTTLVKEFLHHGYLVTNDFSAADLVHAGFCQT